MLALERFATRCLNAPGSHADRRQSLVGIVRPQLQTVLCPRGKHPIGLGHAAGHQVVDHHPDIGLAARQDDRDFAHSLGGGIQPGYQALAAGLLIAGGAIDLAGEDTTPVVLGLQASAAAPRGST